MTTRDAAHGGQVSSPSALPQPLGARVLLHRLLRRWITPVRPQRTPLVAELVEVAVWTAEGGAWQEHASFLLSTRDRGWHPIGFADPATTELVPQLCALPGFDTELLLELIGGHTRRVHTLWRHPCRHRD